MLGTVGGRRKEGRGGGRRRERGGGRGRRVMWEDWWLKFFWSNVYFDVLYKEGEGRRRGGGRGGRGGGKTSIL